MSRIDIKSKRPTSPHLTIYKPQLSSTLSIFHRITGSILFFSFLAISWGVILVLNSYISYEKLFNCFVMKYALMGVTFCFFYHLSTGIRHLYWDAGYGFSIDSVTYSGYAAICSSVVLTIVFLYLIN